MPLDPGARLGPYEILGALGDGGMVEVNAEPPKPRTLLFVENWFEEFRGR